MITNDISILSAFIAGIISFFSPCVLPLIPAYIAYIGGGTKDVSFKILLPRVILFIIGFTVVFTLLGATATFLGSFLKRYLQIIVIFSALLLILFGLHLLGLLKWSLLNKDSRFQIKKSQSFFTPLVLGMAFAFGWSPCIGPVLASILLLASMQQSLTKGILLLFFYSLGLGIPFLVVALATNKIFAELKKINKYTLLIEKIAGIIMVIFGIYLFYQK